MLSCTISQKAGVVLYKLCARLWHLASPGQNTGTSCPLQVPSSRPTSKPPRFVFSICSGVDGLYRTHGNVSQAFVHWSHLHGTTTPSQFPGHSNNWLEYVQSQDAIWDNVADLQDGITLIIRGDGYPVAGCSCTQLNVSIIDHGRHVRTTSHKWVIPLAYASDKDMEDLKILWKTNVEVCCAAFFVMFHRKMNFSS